jgi:hypothetical protein
MDRDFITRNQIVERYLAGQLPLKGAQDFERYCREFPHLLDEIGLSARIHAALRLLEAGGRPPPWEPRPPPWWQHWAVIFGAVLLALVASAVALTGFTKVATRDQTIAVLQRKLRAQPLDAADSTRTLTLVPNRIGPSSHSLATIGGADAELADLKLDVSWSKSQAYRITIDRLGQGRVAILYNVLRDSSGVLHIALNTSALGPGDYQLSIDGLNWRGVGNADCSALTSLQAASRTHRFNITSQ